MGSLLPGALREALRQARQTAGEQNANGLPLAPSVTMWPASGVEPGATDTSNGAPQYGRELPVPPPPPQQQARNLNKATALREARREARQRAEEPVVVQGKPVIVHGETVVE